MTIRPITREDLVVVERHHNPRLQKVYVTFGLKSLPSFAFKKSLRMADWEKWRELILTGMAMKWQLRLAALAGQLSSFSGEAEFCFPTHPGKDGAK